MKYLARISNSFVDHAPALDLPQ